MAPVKLYVYDLSNGLARSLSLQLTGRQIDGIWHTSVVAFGKEVYYGPYNAGPGIQITSPGWSHHGQPLRVEDMGETELDEDTFMEYITDVQEMYTGEKYHLLDFNCNSFTNDCIGFLTGGSIPSYIRDLPSDFLSTPFGASLRPTIDNMYRRPTPGPVPGPDTLNPLAASNLPSSSAANGSQTVTSTSTLTSPIQTSSNPSSFQHILDSHKAVVAYFTSDTCSPCRMIKPVFQQLAEEKASTNVAFVEVNFSHGMSSAIGSKYSVSVTPTFLFFLDGKRVSEMKGVNAPELKSQVDYLLYEAFPPHPHTQLDLSALRAISLNPILFSQLPPSLDTVNTKFVSFIDEISGGSLDKGAAKTTITQIIEFLKERFADKGKSITTLQPYILDSFSNVTLKLLQMLPPQHLFPLLDLWRLLILDQKVVASLINNQNPPSSLVLESILSKMASLQMDPANLIPRSLLLTFLRLAANCFVSPGLIMGKPTNRQSLTTVVVPSLLHEDPITTTAAASVMFNVAAFVQKPRFDAQKARATGGKVEAAKDVIHPLDDPDWEVEMISAIVERLQRETKNEGIIHRLSASLGFFLHLSPYLDEVINPLLEVLSVKDTLKSKMASGGPIAKPDVKKAVQDVAALCP